ALTAACLQSDAKIWRINNNGFSSNFSNLQAANDDANVMAGDTLHIEGSNTVYTGANINKKLIIIGPGYFLNENPKTSTTVSTAMMNLVSFRPGSAGSQLIGIHVGVQTGAAVYIGESNITVKRCQIENGI